jgi:CRP/FNR family transcriptional regulator, cyclic AMP receptor protein
MAELVQNLSRVPMFAGMKEKELKRLAKGMAERTFKEGDEIATEGESGVGFFVIEDGNATVTLKGEVVNTLGPGDHFGEIALIDRGPRTATVVAATELRCRGMTSWEFRPFVQSHPEVAWPLLEHLVGRLREAEERGGK